MVGSNGIVQPPPPPDGRSACRRSQRLRTRPAAFRGSSRHGRSPTDFRGSVASQTYGPSHRRLGRAGLEPANAALARSQVRPRAATNESGLRLTGHDTIADALADASTTSHLSGSRLWVRQPSSPRDRYGGRHVHGRRCAPMIDDTQTLRRPERVSAGPGADARPGERPAPGPPVSPRPASPPARVPIGPPPRASRTRRRPSSACDR
jgi:hypothetical protein